MIGRKKRLFFIFLILIFSFSFFIIPFSNAIVNENDINFSWINSKIYDNDDLIDYDVSDTTNYVEYNDSDYFEHANAFNSINYSGTNYIENTDHFLNQRPRDFVFVNDYYYCFNWTTDVNIYIYDSDFNEINQTTNSLQGLYSHIAGVCTDNEYIYCLVYKQILGTVYYFVVRLDFNLEYVDTIIEIDMSDYYLLFNIECVNMYVYISGLEIGAYNAIVSKYDLSGNFIIEYDLSSKVSEYPLGLVYYNDFFYIYDSIDDDIHIYDIDFNYVKVIALSLTDYMINMKIYNDIVYYIDFDGAFGMGYYITHMLDINFQEQDFYSYAKYYPESNGLFDSVDNVNISLNQQTNAISNNYQANDSFDSYNMTDGNYYGTYSFEGQTGLSGTDISCVYGVVNTPVPTVVDSFGGHNEVINSTNLGDGGLQRWYDLFGYKTDSTVELWMSSTDTTKYGSFFFCSDGYGLASSNIMTIVQFTGGYIQSRYGDGFGGYTTNNMISAINDIWYHVKVELDFTLDQVTVSVDGTEYVSAENFYYDNNFDSWNCLSQQNQNDNEYSIYLDAVGYSWDADYEIGYNINPYDITDLLDNDYSFTFNNGNIVNITDIDGHDDVIGIYDDTTVHTRVWKSFENQISGTIEFWTRTTVASQYLTFMAIVKDGSFQGYLHADASGNFAWHTYVSGVVDLGVLITVNQWYHCKIDFNSILDTVNITIDGNLLLIDGEYLGNTINGIAFNTPSATSANLFTDGLDYSWSEDYFENRNIAYTTENNGFWTEIEIQNELQQTVLSLECRNGSYYIDDISIEFDMFFDNDSSLLYDSGYFSVLETNILFDINQTTENGSLYIYNKNNSLLFNCNFDTENSGNIKFIKFIEHYQNSSHYNYISNFILESNATKISGNSAFISYDLDLIDTTVWSLQLNSILKLSGYGRYRLYVSNESYDDCSYKYLISDFIDLRNTERELNLESYDHVITNPYLIIESLNGIYLLDSIIIDVSSISWMLYDDRDFYYHGTLEYQNIDINQSFFYIQSNRLYFQISYNDTDLEYMKLTFDIENNDNVDYQLLYSSYISSSNSSLDNRIQFFCTDGSYIQYDLNAFYSSNIETLNQNKVISEVQILISDNDLQNNFNLTGYIGAFTFNYSGELNISLFVEAILIMLIPLIIILSVSFSLSYVFRKDNDSLNKSVFFPIFLFTSILVFILGFFDAWILFILIIDAIAYVSNKRVI